MAQEVVSLSVSWWNVVRALGDQRVWSIPQGGGAIDTKANAHKRPIEGREEDVGEGVH